VPGGFARSELGDDHTEQSRQIVIALAGKRYQLTVAKAPRMKVKGVTIDTSDARQTDAGCSRDPSIDLKSRTTLDSPCLLWVICALKQTFSDTVFMSAKGQKLTWDKIQFH
jgi:hypothetical protein